MNAPDFQREMQLAKEYGQLVGQSDTPETRAAYRRQLESARAAASNDGERAIVDALLTTDPKAKP
jgi:hypothetical protein